MKLKDVILESIDKDKILEYLKKELSYHKNNSHDEGHKTVAHWLKIYIKHIQKM